MLYATIKTESLLNIVGNLVVLVAKLSQEKSGQMHPCTVINFSSTVNTYNHTTERVQYCVFKLNFQSNHGKLYFCCQKYSRPSLERDSEKLYFLLWSLQCGFMFGSVYICLQKQIEWLIFNCNLIPVLIGIDFRSSLSLIKMPGESL